MRRCQQGEQAWLGPRDSDDERHPATGPGVKIYVSRRNLTRHDKSLREFTHKGNKTPKIGNLYDW